MPFSFLRKPGLQRFIKYSVAGGSAFLVDLLLLLFLLNITEVHYLIAVPSAFILATTLHYLLVRSWAYRESTRGRATGLVIFLIIISSSLLLVSGGVALLAELFFVPIIVARIAMAPVIGLWSFALNSKIAFKTPILR